MYRRLTETMSTITSNYELIWVNDSSPDNAETLLSSLAAQDERVTVISHSRNFGSQMAFTSGMEQSLGEAVVLMDGDLQDPPEVILDFVRQWLRDYEVVYGVRTHRYENPLIQSLRKLFYRIFHRLSYINMPLDAGDFSLMSRRVVNHLLAMPERDRFLRGLRSWVGFRQIGVPYKRAARFSGKTTNSFLDNIRWAKQGIFSFSYRPLEMISTLAFLTTLLAGSAIALYIIRYLTNPDAPAGFMTLVTIMLFLGAIQLFGLSVIAEYLGRIFEEVKQRPQFIVKEIINNHRIKDTKTVLLTDEKTTRTFKNKKES